MKKTWATFLLNVGCWCFSRLYPIAIYHSKGEKVTSITFTMDEKIAQYIEAYSASVVTFPDREDEMIVGHTMN